METLSKPAVVTSWLLRLMVAGILLQTLYFKFTAAPEAVYIFSKLGLEPWGRIGSGLAELAAAVLLSVPRTGTLGALLSAGIISGAIVSHMTKLGIVVQDDGGLLFILAMVVFIGSVLILALRYAELGRFVQRVFNRLVFLRALNVTQNRSNA